MTTSGGRRTILIAAIAIIVLSAGCAIAIHLLVGLLTLRIAVASSHSDGERAATALVRVFAANHPRVRVRTVLEPSLPAVTAAFDAGRSELAIVRSDAAGQNAQTLVILRQDAAMFVAPDRSGIDGIAKLAGRTVGLLDGRRIDSQLLDLVLDHYGVRREDVRRKPIGLAQLEEALRKREIDVIFIVAPVRSRSWFALYGALRKHAGGAPKTFEIDETAAIAQQNPVLETIDVPKGTFQGSLPSPADDIPTLSVSYRLVASSTMPDWLAGEITKEILTNKQRLATADADLVGIQAPDPDDKKDGLPIHSGTAAYLSGNLPSTSDQAQNVLYWIGLVASAAASLFAASAAIYSRVRPRRPPARVMRLLEIWLAIRDASHDELEAYAREADALVADAVRDEANGHSKGAELRLIPLVASHVRDAIQRRLR